MKITLANVRAAATAAASVNALCLSVLDQGADGVAALATHLTTIASEGKRELRAAHCLYMSFSKAANHADSPLRIRMSGTYADKVLTAATFAPSEGGKLRQRAPRAGSVRAITADQRTAETAVTLAAESSKRANDAQTQIARLSAALAAMGLTADRIAAIRDGSVAPESARMVPAIVAKRPATPASKPAAVAPAQPKPNNSKRAAAAPAQPKPSNSKRTCAPRSRMATQRSDDAPAAAAAA